MGTKQPSILCVDDDQGILAALKRILRDDFIVATTTDVEEGARILKDNPDIALVISDHRMPGVNGFDFLKWCRENRSAVVRIALTGYPDAELMKEALNSGLVERIIAKPWDDEQIIHILKKAVEQPGGQS